MVRPLPPADSRLRDTINTAGCTYEALAKDAGRIAAENGEPLKTKKSAVSHWAKGTLVPSGQAGHYLAEAPSRRLDRVVTQSEIGFQSANTEPSGDGDQVTAVTNLGRADVERSRFLAIAARTPGARQTQGPPVRLRNPPLSPRGGKLSLRPA